MYYNLKYAFLFKQVQYKAPKASQLYNILRRMLSNQENYIQAMKNLWEAYPEDRE